MKYYCLTIRKCTPLSKYSQLSRLFNEYENYIRSLKFRHEQLEIEYHYECVPKLNGKYNIHLHAMLKSPNEILRVHQKQGYSIKFELANSKRAWNLYITKSNLTRRDIELHLQDMFFPHDEDSFIDEPDNPPIIYKKKLF